MIPAKRAAVHALRFPVAIMLAAAAVACVVQRPVVRQLDVQRPPVRVQSPVKAHLIDGSTAIFPEGVTLVDNTVTGTGLRYSIAGGAPVNAGRIPLDSIVGMESYGRDVNAAGSVALSVVGVVAGAFVTAGALVAVFGSCPTFYADSAGVELLQGEGFSYAIAPLFEQRDVDRLRLTPTADGRVVLHVKNEALETHYINNIELIEVRHAADEQALPDAGGHPLAVGNARLNAALHDRAGRDISRVVARPDDDVFSTVDSRIASVSAADLDDYVDVSFSPPAGTDSVAVILDMRNSLLNTVLLYDNILGAPGITSLDYVGRGLEHISNAVDLGRWYASNMGMRVSVLDGGGYRRIARIGDSGPIAYHRMGVLVPAIRGNDGLVHVRLSFVADDWRIDEISIAGKWRRPEMRPVPISRITVPDPKQASAAMTALRQPDESYLITVPGESFRLEFDVGTNATLNRTWFAVSQGYYSEWVRGDWIKNATGKPFAPTNETLVDAIRGWHSKQAAMEKKFYNQRVSAR